MFFLQGQGKVWELCKLVSEIRKSSKVWEKSGNFKIMFSSYPSKIEQIDDDSGSFGVIIIKVSEKSGNFVLDKEWAPCLASLDMSAWAFKGGLLIIMQ